ncbi:MAG: UDP-3-O-(3-hydroxymyristoyl)glucosamine N-acyltransferase, partial [Calothrix sp. SM1_5_4]|nr:UDP-3-O-(3-hydroxymyristoyl)glucosamine N-acyltransferase [Calothrix sp. SM1_5_4]
MKVRVSRIQERFPDLLPERIGSAETDVERVSPPAQADAASMVFVTDGKYLSEALASPAPILVVSFKEKAVLEKHPVANGRSILFSKNVKLAMALVKAEYFAHEKPLQAIGTIHPTAIIDPTAVLGMNVSVGPYSCIGEGVIIEDNVRVDASVVVEADCRIGKDSHLYSHVYIGPRTVVGERCRIMPHCTIGSEGFGFAHDERGRFHRIPQTGKVVLENDVEVGANSTIDRATFDVTRVGEGTKIDKHAHISHNCDIGKHCVMAGKFAVAGSTKIGDHFIAGGRVTVTDGITVVAGVEVAGLSGVQTSITAPGQYGGFPIQPVRDAL